MEKRAKMTNPIDDHPVRANYAHAQGIAQIFESKIADAQHAYEVLETRRAKAVQRVKRIVEEQKQEIDKHEEALSNVNRKIYEVASALSKIAPMSSIPVLTTDEGEIKVTLEDDAFGEVDEQIAKDFKQALADTGDAEMQEQYYRLKFQLDELNEKKQYYLKKETKIHKRTDNKTKFALEEEATLTALSQDADAELTRLLMMRDDIEGITKEVSANAKVSVTAKADATVLKKSDGTLYTGTITVPPHSTVELPLDDLIKENNQKIASAKEIGLATNKLKLKTAETTKLTRQAMVRVGALKRDADHTPDQILQYYQNQQEGNTMPFGNPTMIYSMQFCQKHLEIGDTIDILCMNKMKGKTEDIHAQRQVAIRGGFICENRTAVKIMHHVTDNRYLVHFLHYDVVTEIAIIVPKHEKIKVGNVMKENTAYNKYVIGTCLNWHPKWTSSFERSGKIIPADAFTNHKYTLQECVRFHRQLMDALPALPSIVPDIAMDVVGLPKDPTSATAIALGD